MQSVESRLIYSATDLGNFLGCQHLTWLSREVAIGLRKKPIFNDPSLDALWQRGLDHEQRFLARLKASGLQVTELAGDRKLFTLSAWGQYADETIQAMRGGADVIYQGALFDGEWAGKPDFLLKVTTPSDLGSWSYEIADTKLAREAKGGALLQVLLYADLLARVQGRAPDHVHLALGGPEARTERFRVTDYAAYFRSIKQRFLEHVANAPSPLSIAPEPVAHCDICAWSSVCSRERREVDHLSLVAGITRNQRRALHSIGVATTASLGGLDPKTQVDSIGNTALERIREQARIQVQGRESGKYLHELLLPIEAELGLAALPAPSQGDLFFDLEGDPYVLEDGIEYLFGYADASGAYTGVWALDHAQEKRAFEQFMDFAGERLKHYPDLHIYHYNHYEPTALKKLVGRYSTREDELDRLLRGKVFVDLYRVVRNGLRASVESYSIKKLEPLYGFAREQDLKSANLALASFEAWMEGNAGAGADAGLLQNIEAYNRDDVISTLRLRDWLEQVRAEHERSSGTPIPRPAPDDPNASEEVAKRNAEVDALMARLTADLPLEVSARSPEQHARWLIAQLLEFYRREKKSVWWEYFRRLGLSDEELIEDGSTLGGIEYVGPIGPHKQSIVHQYRYPKQEHDFKAGDKAKDPATQKSVGEIYRIDDARRVFELTRGKKGQPFMPKALIPDENVPDKPMDESLLRIGYAIAEHGLTSANPYRAAIELLLRNAPRAGQTPNESLVRPGESSLDATCRVVAALDHSVLPIQGPPGAGKTYTAARVIVNELRRGRRVGVTATSHKVIGNLLDEVCEAAQEAKLAFAGIQKADDDQACTQSQITVTDDNAEVLAALQTGAARLAAGTAWLWAREDMIGAVDVLFIDEAGQFSVANALAVAPAAKNLVLLGDPQQLQQPQKGVHPPGAEVSALDHLLGDQITVPANRGIFLEETWRLHPAICEFTSEIFYEGRLQSRPNLHSQDVRAAVPFAGAGPRLIALEHQGNDNDSPEEVELIASLVDRIIADGSTWIDQDGEEKPITLSDILIVAAYNAQVDALAARLPAGARVGTVDKFQGQEAPIAIYSMASSSAEDAPRGMKFLYSPNRLNVATSRARCVALVVASDAIFAPECHTPEQMRLANALCRFRELATGLTAPAMLDTQAVATLEPCIDP
jgi:predicted RecB family nuclease